jgi:phosphoribosylanthranilate isomerase
MVLSLSLSADAQRGGRAQLPPEKQDAVWALQAATVATELDLSAEVATKLSEAYKATRKAYADGVDKLSAQNLERRERFEASRKVADEERGKFETALKAFLDETQATQATAALGTFYWRWDSYVSTVADFGLEDAKQQQALTLVNAYAVDVAEALEEAVASEDFEGMREAMQKLKTKLDTALAAILSAEQLTKWKEATAPRGRG